MLTLSLNDGTNNYLTNLWVHVSLDGLKSTNWRLEKSYIVWVFSSTIIHQHSSSKEIKEKVQSHTNPNYYYYFLEGNNILPCEGCCESVRSDVSSCLHFLHVYPYNSRYTGTNKDKYISIIWTIRTTAPNT